jgi:hypothetical protein
MGSTLISAKEIAMRHRMLIVLVLLCLMGCSSPAASLQPTPTEAPSSTLEPTVTPGIIQRPSASIGFDLVYDTLREQVLMINGQVGSADQMGLPNYLYAWDGTQWLFLGEVDPPARALAGTAFDTRRGVLIVYGGAQSATLELDDTWEWDGTTWHQIQIEGPFARDHIAAAFDEARGEMVIFGGVHGGGNVIEIEADTWTYDGERWRQAATDGPDAQAHYALTYHPAREQVLMFGGVGESNRQSNELWAWDGSTWQIMSENEGPAPRDAAAIAYHSGTGMLLLFGGRGLAGNYGDTWTWDGETWTRVDVDGPSPRSFAEMAYDAKRDMIVLFGGYVDNDRTLDDTWLWDGSRWIQADSGSESE